jgi:hypothetical protein
VSGFADADGPRAAPYEAGPSASSVSNSAWPRTWTGPTSYLRMRYGKGVVERRRTIPMENFRAPEG